MKKYPMDMTDKRCATCKWHRYECVNGCCVCANDKSDYYNDWTDDDFGCEKWEAEH